MAEVRRAYRGIPLGEVHEARKRPQVPEQPDLREGTCASGEFDINIWMTEHQEDVRRARALCNHCPVREPCLEWALEISPEYGTWGGLTWREIRRRRSAARQAR